MFCRVRFAVVIGNKQDTRDERCGVSDGRDQVERRVIKRTGTQGERKQKTAIRVVLETIATRQRASVPAPFTQLLKWLSLPTSVHFFYQQGIIAEHPQTQTK